MSKPKPTEAQLSVLGDTIHYAREAAGLTQEQLAEIIDCSPRWVQKLESCKSNPHWLTLMQLCALLDINIRELEEKLGLGSLEGAL